MRGSGPFSGIANRKCCVEDSWLPVLEHVAYILIVNLEGLSRLRQRNLNPHHLDMIAQS